MRHAGWAAVVLGVATVVSPSQSPPAADEIQLAAPAARPGPGESLWAEVDTCRQQALLGRLPALVRTLEVRARRQPAAAPRCCFEAGRLELALGADAKAAHFWRRAMAALDDEYGRRAALAYARLASRTGRPELGLRALRALKSRAPVRAPGLKVSAIDAVIGMARLRLEAGSPRRALKLGEQARLMMPAEDPASYERRLAMFYDLACIEGQAYEAQGLVRAAIRLYWHRLEEDPDGCAEDPRIPLALARLHRARGELPELRAALTLLARRSGPLSAATILLEYLDLMDLAEKENLPGFLTETEGIDPALWKHDEGQEWPFFRAARALVESDPRRARDAVLGHLERHGYFTLGVHILGLVGDERSLNALYKLAVLETADRDLRNIVTAIARHRRPLAVGLLRRLQRDSSAADPPELRRAAQLALQSLPPVSQTM